MTAAEHERLLDRAADLASPEGREGLAIAQLSDGAADAGGLDDARESETQLQLAMWEATNQYFIAQVIAPTLDVPIGRPRLEALCEAYIEYTLEDQLPGGCFMASVTEEFDRRPVAVREAIVQGVGAWLDWLTETARQAGATNPRQLAFEVQSAVQGMNQEHLMFGDPVASEYAREAIAATLDRLLDDA